MNIVFFGYGMLELGGGFENYLIDTSLNIFKLEPEYNIKIVTSTPKLTEQYYSTINKFSFKHQSSSSLYRESRQSIEKRLGPVNYEVFNSISELKKILSSADIIYSKNEYIELILLKLMSIKKIAPIIIGVSTPIKYPYTPTFSAKLHNLFYTAWFYRWLLKSASIIKTLNNEDNIYVRKELKLRNVGKLHPGFNVNKSKPTYSKAGSLNIMFAGRLTEQKGVDILVNVIDSINKRNEMKTIIFKIAGAGNKQETTIIKSLSKKYENVIYLGHVPQSEMNNLYVWADVVIIPSKFETLNKVAVETGMHGKIAICSNIPGPREVIEHGKTGYLSVPSGEGFYNTIANVLHLKETNFKLFESIGINAQNKMNREFNNIEINLSLLNIMKFLKSDPVA